MAWNLGAQPAPLRITTELVVPAPPGKTSPDSAKKARYFWQRQAAEKSVAAKIADEEFCSIDVARFDRELSANRDRYEGARSFQAVPPGLLQRAPQVPSQEPAKPKALSVDGAGPTCSLRVATPLQWQSQSPLLLAMSRRAEQHRLAEQAAFRQQVAEQKRRGHRRQFLHGEISVPPVPQLPLEFLPVGVGQA